MPDNEIINYETFDKEKVKGQILEIRGYRVMLDKDIALYFGVETKALNRAMKRNIKRFPDNFCFQLTKEVRCHRSYVPVRQGFHISYCCHPVRYG